MDFARYGLDQIEPEPNCIVARVSAVHRERYELLSEHGQTFGRLKGSIYLNDQAEDYPVTGDFVLIKFNSSGDSQIIKTLPRKTYFSRRIPDKVQGEQAVAANFDFVFIMQSINFDFNPRRIERYVTLAWQSGAVPVLVLTKADLVTDASSFVHAAGEVAPGVDIHVISTVNGVGLQGLKTYLQPDKTVVLLGSSGVGKSSLVNALVGQTIMAVKEIREDDSRGRHTTTHRQLIVLDNGAMIIDTPGMRELGMWDVTEGLGEAFQDVEHYFFECRFSDCRHETEPGCAVRGAIRSGELSLERWNSYLNLKREARFTSDKDGYLREKKQWGKNIAKGLRQQKKNKNTRSGH